MRPTLILWQLPLALIPNKSAILKLTTHASVEAYEAQSLRGLYIIQGCLLHTNALTSCTYRGMVSKGELIMKIPHAMKFSCEIKGFCCVFVKCAAYRFCLRKPNWICVKNM